MLLPEEKVKEKVIEKERSLIEKIKETPEPFRIFSLKPSMIKSYITSDDNVDDLLEIQLVPFESLVQVPEYHSHFRNMHYHLRFYFPKTNGKDAKYKHLFIMFNGLAESTPAIYDDLGLEFAKHGIPSALFPLPNRFIRRPHFNCDENDIFTAINKDEAKLTTQEIVIEITHPPEKIIHGYTQMMSDVERFINITQDSDIHPHFHEFYNKHFDNNTKICLLGVCRRNLF